MKIIDQLLPYNDRLEKRDTRTLRTVVIHCTELPDLKEARLYGEKIMYPDSGTGVSGHFYIDRDGCVYRYVCEDRIAHHVIGHNSDSIGIELINRGRYPNWFDSNHQAPSEVYPEVQLSALKELLRYLKQTHPTIKELARHSDLDTQMIPAQNKPEVEIRRKIDPGPLFPWDDLLRFWSSL